MYSVPGETYLVIVSMSKGKKKTIFVVPTHFSDKKRISKKRAEKMVLEQLKESHPKKDVKVEKVIKTSNEVSGDFITFKES